MVAADGRVNPTLGKCCQTDVAHMMRAKRQELEAAGKSLLFVGASGDNFYHSGLLDEDKGGEMQWARWSAVYAGRCFQKKPRKPLSNRESARGR